MQKSHFLTLILLVALSCSQKSKDTAAPPGEDGGVAALTEDIAGLPLHTVQLPQGF